MNEHSLEQKIRDVEQLLSDLLDKVGSEGIRVAWTGGKDSTVALFIWKALLDHRGLGPVQAINLDTGCKFPEVVAFRDRLAAEWGINLHIARPEVALDGYPLAADPVACCRELKVEPLRRAIRETGTTHLITGIRRDEHPDRAGRQPLEPRKDPDHVMVNPLLDWTETDIWALHHRFNIPHCKLYDRGYRSLGCLPCTAEPGASGGERAGRNPAKESVLNTLTSLGYF
ncbi:phosphoadenosine phosphosulfate reductase family protein [Pseudodesulfovibrio cashew]|uniref:Phosphoadenosine phosphosulfate reductase family protein n=1 Tax=Pseudodesulfovibrio cashew TaxID=2678688 RepID=A0A6I6J8J1_9BACT|nr:phosphoadenosine phosphosulfate reductase family protein [Pseudodesulfovibrio cashew]QGY38885.1 phosphoadenosine phosphosulfate reductase family protein [Pseudodesulfovibrio cashew]